MPTATPTPAPTATPTAGEVAHARLSEIVPWFRIPPDADHAKAGRALRGIWLRDADLGSVVAEAAWVVDGVDYTEAEALRLLNGIAAIDAALARLVANGLSAAGGVTADRMVLLRYLVELAAVDATLATMIAGYPWIVDGIGVHERAAIGALRSLAARDAALARVVAGYPWVNDGIFPHEVDAIEELRSLAATDAALANAVAGFRWVADDMTLGESWTLGALYLVADTDLSRAWLLLETAGQASGDWQGRVARSLARLALSAPDGFDELTRELGVADGLTDEETALLIVLLETRSRDRRLYDDLVHSHHVQTGTVSLPLAGEVDIWLFGNAPFLLDEDLLAIVADTVRIFERFLSVPFPVNDIVLLVVTESATSYEMQVENWGTLLVDKRSWNTQAPNIAPLTARYYLRWGLGPPWLRRGGPSFMESYWRDRLGIESLEDRKHAVWDAVEAYCHDKGIPNILKLSVRVRDNDSFICSYSLVEYFLLDLFETLGEEATGAAIRELYLLYSSEGRPVTEEEIYQAFLDHTPAGLEEEFRDVYRRLHGGSFVDR